MRVQISCCCSGWDEEEDRPLIVDQPVKAIELDQEGNVIFERRGSKLTEEAIQQLDQATERELVMRHRMSLDGQSLASKVIQDFDEKSRQDRHEKKVEEKKKDASVKRLDAIGNFTPGTKKVHHKRWNFDAP